MKRIMMIMMVPTVYNTIWRPILRRCILCLINLNAQTRHYHNKGFDQMVPSSEVTTPSLCEQFQAV